MVRETILRIRYGYDTITVAIRHDAIRYAGSWDDTDTDRMRCDTIAITIRYDTTRYDTITIRCDTTRCGALARETIRYEADTIRMRCDTMRYTMYDTDTMRNDTIHWFVIMMAPHLLIGFVSLSSILFFCLTSSRVAGSRLNYISMW